MIIWKGHGILVGVAAVLGGMGGSALGAMLGGARGAMVGGALVAAALAWLYVKTIGKTTVRQYVDPATGQPVVVKSAHTLYFIPVVAWAWIISVISAVMCVSAMFSDFSSAPSRSAEENEALAATGTGAQAVKAASDLVASHGQVAWHGSNEAAVELARQFSTELSDLRDAGIEKRKKKATLSLSKGKMLTYCRLSEGTCAFITHVQDLRKFTDEAKAVMRELAWLEAGRCAERLDPKPARLAVGLRGAFLYDSVTTGTPGGGFEAQTTTTGAASDKELIPFFAAPATTPAKRRAAGGAAPSAAPSGQGEPR